MIVSLQSHLAAKVRYFCVTVCNLRHQTANVGSALKFAELCHYAQYHSRWSANDVKLRCAHDGRIPGHGVECAVISESDILFLLVGWIATTNAMQILQRQCNAGSVA